jgi:hypothetical protein
MKLYEAIVLRFRDFKSGQHLPITSRESENRGKNEMSSSSKNESLFATLINPSFVILWHFTRRKHRRLLVL